jgi:hypothetical protein
VPSKENRTLLNQFDAKLYFRSFRERVNPESFDVDWNREEK